MAKKIAGQIEEIGGRIEQFAGKDIRQKVMEGSDRIASSSDMKKVSLWVKNAMERLDASVSPEKRKEIMVACGRNCSLIHDRTIQAAKARRQKFSTEDAFLQAELKKPAKGTRLELKGKTLIQYYNPRVYSTPMRCYCSLMRHLPEGTNAPLTYCQCSCGFIERQWQETLGRPVKVEVKETSITGSDECKFIIHL
jgi:hypothetical protein